MKVIEQAGFKNNFSFNSSVNYSLEVDVEVICRDYDIIYQGE